ncbi:MAG: choice-of-anchor L domain-containing protein [Flavobacteriales bacterium]|nr:choice-of-anchor L domain-containing protein [Flavobacteriales bacterium]
MKNRLILTFSFLLFSIILKSQVAVNTGVTVNDLVTAISGPGVIITNANLNCPNGAYGTFSGGAGSLGLTDGIILTTGDATLATGPNLSGSDGFCNGTSGTDPDLTAIEPLADQDVCTLEFDVVPQCDVLTLDFVFASDEYPEYVNAGVNDAFGFFLTGPNPGGGNYNSQNVAVIPGTSTPVAIDNINATTNSGYYIDNAGGNNTAYDGLTTAITSSMPVVQCQTYHMKLVIADASDCIYDSGVFLDFEGLTCPNSDASLNPIVTEAAEGCIDASFEIIANFAVATTVNISTTGTATNGVDFTTTSSYNLPAGPSTTPVTISPFADGLVEGTETMNIVLSYNVCGTLVYDTLPMTILDQPTINFTSSIENCGACDGTASATFNNAALPIATYTWSPVPGGGQGTPNVTGLCEDTYILSIVDANGCPATDSVSIGSACSCNIDSLTAVIGACQPATSTYDVSGNVYFSNAPASGTLTISDCNGNTDVISAPFSSPEAFSLTGLTADGLACSITAIFSADAACTTTLPYNAPTSCTPNCSFTSIADTIGFCDPGTNLFPRYGEVTFTDAPATGMLIFTDCLGNSDTLLPPFTSPSYYYFEANSNGTTNCDVTATFTADPACTINIAQDYPVACGCPADAGTTTAGIFGDGQMNYILCHNDTIIIAANGDHSDPNDVGPLPGANGPIPYNPGITYGIYTCPPTPNTAPHLDPCYTGYVTGTITNFGDVNVDGDSGGLLGFMTGIGFVFTDNTVYYVPMTLYNQDSLSYNTSCVDAGLATAVTYLPEITTSNPTEDCQDSSFTITINGGYPELLGGNFTVSNLLPATASFVNTTCANGGTIQINGLLNGDMYSFDVQDTNGCPITVSGGPFVGLPSANAGIDDTTCTLTYVMSATPSYGTGTWTGQAGVSVVPVNSATGTATATAAGTYELYWTEDNGGGCTSVDTVEITFSAPSYSAVVNDAACGNADGSITITAVDGIAPYTYSNDNGLSFQAVDSFVNLTVGPYNIVVEDAVGCQVTGIENVNNFGSPSIDSFTLTDPLCNGDCNGQIIVHGSGGTAPYQYSIDGGVLQADSTFAGLCGATTYTLLIEDAIGCQVSKDTVLIDPTILTLDSAVYTNINCNGDNNGTITLYATGGTGALEYSIDNQVSYGAASNFTTLAPGNYQVWVRDANNCTDSTSLTITEPTPLTIASVVDSVVCFGTATGQVQALGQGGTSPYDYQWSSSANTGTTESNLFAGTVDLIVTDDHGCTKDSTFTIFEPAQFTYTTASQNANCNQPDGWAAIINFAGGTGNYTYQWDANTANQITDTAFNLTPGTYDVTVTDENMCDTVISVTVGNNPSFTTSITNIVNVTCFGGNDGEATANGSDPLATYNYTWTNTNPVQNTQTVTGLSAGVTYYVTIEDATTGCTEYDSVMVTEPTKVEISNVSPDVPICYGQSTNLTATATGGSGSGYTYTWNNGLGAGQNHTVSPLTTTSYEVWAEDENGCPSDTGYVTVTVTPQLSVLMSQDTSICPETSVGISAFASQGNGGPYTYSWSPASSLNDASLANPTASPTQTTTYTVTVSDNCSPDITGTVTVTIQPLPQPTALVDTLSLCEQPQLPFTFYNTTDSTNGMMDTTTVVWYWGDGSYSTYPWDTITHTYSSPGSYQISMEVVSTEAQGECPNTLVVVDEVIVHPLPTPDFLSNPNPTTMFEPTVEFVDITNNTQLADWDFAGLGTSTFSNPTFTFPDDTSGVYPVTLTITDIHGCVNEITKVVIVKGEHGLFVPNTFTPDFDFKNDVFMPKGFGILEEGYSFMIFNRWGQKIYETHTWGDGWDATYGGQPVQEDTYVWKIIYKDVNGELYTKHGHVNVIK